MVFGDEIYDQMTYDGNEFIPDAPRWSRTRCAPRFRPLEGLSRLAAIRVGWVSFAGRKSGATDYFAALELLSSLRLCSNVPAQWAVQTALGGYQSIKELVSPGGRLYESAACDRERGCRPVASSTCSRWQGAMYALHRCEDR